VFTVAAEQWAHSKVSFKFSRSAPDSLKLHKDVPAQRMANAGGAGADGGHGPGPGPDVAAQSELLLGE